LHHYQITQNKLLLLLLLALICCKLRKAKKRSGARAGLEYLAKGID